MQTKSDHSAWSIAPPSARSLVQLFRSGDSAFLSPACSVLTSGVHKILPPCAPSGLATQAQLLLQHTAQEGLADPMLMGAIGFAPHTAPHLFIPRGVVMGAGVPPSDARSAVGAATALPAKEQGQAHPARASYLRNVQMALRHIEDGALDKVVLSRSLAIPAQVDPRALIQQLQPRNLLGYTFALHLGKDRTLIGASPELLIRRRGRHIWSHPLAGSTPRSVHPMEDQARAARLLSSTKDHREHAYVTASIQEALAPFCKTLVVPDQPSLVSTTTMWHLGTRIHGELKDPDVSALALALALHPTPAVCGHPQAPAQDFIAQHEGFDRRYFAGLVGWVNEEGDGEWAVTIRCAELGRDAATVYAGAGIVKGSDPEHEWEETEAKMQTMLQALRAAQQQELA